MDERAFPVKIELEEEFEFLQQEIKLEIKTEIDLPIKSELEEGLQSYQTHRSQLPLLTFPSVKEELYESTDLDLLIKSEIVCKVDEQLYQYQESGPLPVIFPPIKDEVNEIVDGSGSQIFIGKNMLSKEGDIETKDYIKIRTKYNRQDRDQNILEDHFALNYLKIRAKPKVCKKQSNVGIRLKCKEESCTKYTRRGSFCPTHGGYQIKHICKEDSCTKYARSGDVCIIHGGTFAKCKEGSCTKYAQRGGFCIKHGGTRNKCKEESCTKYARGGGGFCIKHGGTRAKSKKESCTKYSHGRSQAKCKEGSCIKYALRGGFCISHRGNFAKCKEGSCIKYAQRGGFCIKHGGTRRKCKEESCTKYPKRAGFCISHGRKQAKHKEESFSKYPSKEVSVLVMEKAKINVKKEVVLNMS